MANVWYKSKLTCNHCGVTAREDCTRLHSPGLSNEATDDWVSPGEVLRLSTDDFEIACLTLRHPEKEIDIVLLEMWGCPACESRQWARVEFHFEAAECCRFISACAVLLTPETLSEAHFISWWMEFLAEAGVGEEVERMWPAIRLLCETARRTPRA